VGRLRSEPEEKRWPSGLEGSEAAYVVQASAAHHVGRPADEDAAAPIARRSARGRCTRRGMRSWGSNRLVTRTPVRAHGDATQITSRSATGFSKQGSQMRLPTKQGQAARRGFTKELELQSPQRSVNSGTVGSPAASQALYRLVRVIASAVEDTTRTPRGSRPDMLRAESRSVAELEPVVAPPFLHRHWPPTLAPKTR
jgi:hypothetical protein